MIIDWSGGDLPPGEFEDAKGEKRGVDRITDRREFRVDTETGEVTSYKYPFEVIEIDGEEQLATITEYLTPPIRVWLYL